MEKNRRPVYSNTNKKNNSGTVREQVPVLTKENYVDIAEKIMLDLSYEDYKTGKRKIDLTTSKIRGILSLMTELYTDIMHETDKELSPEYVERIQYIRLRIAYEAGRDNKVVGDFVKKSFLLKYIGKIGNNKEKFLLFFRYMEALVAYHRFYGGEE